jgi:hypothetical protein
VNPTGGRIAAAKTAQPAAKPEGRLARLRATNQRGMYVNLPLLGRAWVELAGDAEVTRIESAVFSEMEAMRLAPVPINALTYDACRTRLTLASAVRDPDNHELAFDTAEAWGGLDVDMINACGIVYNTVREELDPMGLSTLTDVRVHRDPARDRKKKSDTLTVLRYREAVSLSAFYGKPAVELTDTNVLDWLIVTGHVVTVADQHQRKLADRGGPVPAGARRIVNAAFNPRGST